MTKDYPFGKGTVKIASNTTANSSNKVILTVPAGKIVIPLYLIAEITTTATVGNRLLQVVVTTYAGSTNMAHYGVPSGAIAASQVGSLRVEFGTGRTTDTSTGSGPADDAADNVAYRYSEPEYILGASSTIRVLDKAAIAAGADDMDVKLIYVEYDA